MTATLPASLCPLLLLICLFFLCVGCSKARRATIHGQRISSIVPNHRTIVLSRQAVICFVMRPLYHPSLGEITVQGILYALSDPVRVRIYAELAQADKAMNCSAFLPNGKVTLPKSTLS